MSSGHPAIEIETLSKIPASADRVWRRVVTPEGINHELWPWMRMTMPRAMRGRTIDDVKPPDRLGRSWLLLFGFIPFDYDDLGLAELGPGLGRSAREEQELDVPNCTLGALLSNACAIRVA